MASTLYYYVLNAQGDVIALLNANGTLAASTTTARGATIPCMVLTAKRPRMPPSSGTSTRFATVVTITTAKRASTTSRAGTTTLPTAGSLMRMGSYQLWIFRLSICLLTVVIILSTTLTHLGTFLC